MRRVHREFHRTPLESAVRDELEGGGRVAVAIL
jgi:hypothetical protein